MITLQEHIDALDRMVTQGTSVPELRSQIAFIGREVAALEADYARLAEAHTKLQEAKAEVDRQLSDKKQADQKAMDDFLTQKVEQQRKLRQRHTLNYNS
jgi:hypothetical protein